MYIFQVLSPTDRAGLLDDVFALSSAGMLDIRLAFNFSRFLVKEKEFLPWSVALTWFARLDGMLNLSPKYGIYKVSSQLICLFFCLFCCCLILF